MQRAGRVGVRRSRLKTLLKAGILQMELFEAMVCEVEVEGVRYALRRNPWCGYRHRAKYPRAKMSKEEERVRIEIGQLKIEVCLEVVTQRHS